MPHRLVCFAHGKESGPWGTKITHLAEVAKARGFEVMSPDYTGTQDAHERVRMLLSMNPRAEPLVLAGSSMGGYVAAQACAALRPRALFLMAPALYFPGWEEEPTDVPANCCVVHGLHDHIVPVDRAQRFAQRHRSELHLLHSGHILNDQLPTLAFLFGRLLDRVAAEPASVGAPPA